MMCVQDYGFKVILRYEDSEGDLITLSTANDFKVRGAQHTEARGGDGRNSRTPYLPLTMHLIY